jgi:cell wall-associated NlpC family hydrolase
MLDPASQLAIAQAEAIRRAALEAARQAAQAQAQAQAAAQAQRARVTPAVGADPNSRFLQPSPPKVDLISPPAGANLSPQETAAYVATTKAILKQDPKVDPHLVIAKAPELVGWIQSSAEQLGSNETDIDKINAEISSHLTVRNDVVTLAPPLGTGEGKPISADGVRAQVAQWAINQANDPNVGYSQQWNLRDGEPAPGNKRYFDCSALVFNAYKQVGVKLGAEQTGQMQLTASQWADQIPIDHQHPDTSQLKPGDLVVMSGHVAMYTGDGKCVEAFDNFDPNKDPTATTTINFPNQVRAGQDVTHYLSQGDAMVLRPRVTDQQVADYQPIV